MIKGLIFDIGGVLTNDPWEAMFYKNSGNIAKEYRIDPGEVEACIRPIIEEFFFLPPLDGPEHADELEQGFWNKAITALHLTASDPDKFIHQTDAFIQPIAGMADLVREIREKGIPIVLCSSTSEFLYKRQMRALGLTEFLPQEKEILSCRFHTSKKNPEGIMFMAAASALNLEPETCLLIDDRIENFPPAHDVGVKGVLFPQYSEFGATYLRDLFSLIKIL
jgi:HAD superfamily hydrolase (TIGR01509 family)